MAVNSPSNANPSGDKPAAEHHVPLTFEDKLNQFWEKNRAVVFGLCLLVLVVILGKGIWDWNQRGKEREIEGAFQLATTADKQRAFIAAHPGHPLAGVAELQLADEAYASGRSTDALSGYERAIAVLKTGPLATRAQLGRALAKAQAGKTADAIADLKVVLNDTAQFKAARSEAAYQLASLAIDAGNGADAQKYIDQLNQIDPSSVWARRAMSLQASLPRQPAPAIAAPAATPAAGTSATSASSGPKVQIKVPGK